MLHFLGFGHGIPSCWPARLRGPVGVAGLPKGASSSTGWTSRTCRTPIPAVRTSRLRFQSPGRSVGVQTTFASLRDGVRRHLGLRPTYEPAAT